ncbi:MAG TPA: hypothetical protein VLT45_26070 [Kofleriaceae bacterium]|nr:hypothetical protein [Kofleriaceae bacterium]
MRALVPLLVAGCYGPKVPDGVRCSPASPACPSGQTCVTTQAGSICTSMAPVDAPADAAVDAGPDAPPDAQTRFVYEASVAACVNPVGTSPDPAGCSTAAGPNAVRVDADDTGHPWDAFLRFHLDSAFAGRTVTAVHLQLTASTNANSDSPNSGAVYQSTAFALADLSVAEPAKADPTALAGNQGAVALGQTVRWPLPTRFAVINTNVYLELESTSADGVFYDNRNGAVPPQLIVETQ